MDKLLLQVFLPMGLAGSLFVLACVLLRPLATRLRAGWRRLVLLCAALLFVLPLPLLGAFPSAPTQQAAPALGATLAYAPPTAPLYHAGRQLSLMLEEQAVPDRDKMVDTEQGKEGPATGGKMASALALAWATGSGITLAWFVAGHYRLMRRLRNGCLPQPGEEALCLYEVLRTDMGLRRPPVLVCSDAVSAPVLAGVLRPVVVLPARALPPEVLAHALRHELTHYYKKDVPMKYLVLAVCVLHWYNPFAHLLRRQFAKVCEESCDEAVVRGYSPAQRVDYARALLCAAGPAPGYGAFGFAGPAGQNMQRRIRRLLHPAAPARPLRAAAGALVAVLLCVCLLAGCSLGAGAQPSPSGSAGTPGKTLVQVTIEFETDIEFHCPVPDAEYSARGKSEGHRGLDLNASEGTEIFAAAAGTVVAAGPHWTYGRYVVIYHGDNLATLYAHCSTLAVEEGQKVEAQELIATVGDTGVSTGTHLHFEVLYAALPVRILEDGQPLDPLLFIALPEGMEVYG